MKTCPSCHKPITVKIPGKYTCSCGAVVQLSCEKADIYYDLAANRGLKDRLADFSFNMLPLLFTGGAMASIAWEFDLPELFGPYSEAVWSLVSSMLALVFLTLVFFSTYGFIKNIFQKKLSGPEALKSVLFIGFFALVTADFINETGFLYIEFSLKNLISRMGL